MDQMFGRAGNDQLSLDPPMGGLVSQALFTTTEGKRQYHARLKELFAELFQRKDLLARVDSLAAPVQKSFESDKEQLNNFDSEIAGLKERLTTRQKVGKRYLKNFN